VMAGGAVRTVVWVIGGSPPSRRIRRW
jgi:hypothetical protein